MDKVPMFLKLIERIPHSKSRVPYTYHHDYLRQHSKFHSQMSRSEIASNHRSSQDELYAVALVQIVSENPDAVYSLECEDLSILKEAKTIADSVVASYSDLTLI
jgi:hypothetical protein